MDSIKDAMMKVSDIYSIVTNNGYVLDDSNVLGVRTDKNGLPKRAVIEDLLTLPDMTRFIV